MEPINGNKKKVLFTSNVPSPYRVDFFNELGKYCDLTVLFEKNTSDERDASWKSHHFKAFRGIVMQGKSVAADMAYCSEVTRYVKTQQWDAIFCTDFISPTGMKLTRYLRRHHIPYYLESDGGFAGKDNPLKKFIKTHAVKGAQAYFCTGDSHAEYYKAYGADPDCIIRYPFSSVFARDVLTQPLTQQEKRRLKQSLGMSEEIILLAVGQFIPRKGFDLLLDAAQSLPANVGIYFVGGIPTEEYLTIQRQHHLENVHFEGFRLHTELQKYYQAADIFVLPTREDIWGLVINEALANGLPVITTERCLAGAEMLQNGVNGYVIPADNTVALTESVLWLTKDSALRCRMAEQNVRKARLYTIETMVQAHVQFLNRIGSGDKEKKTDGAAT